MESAARSLHNILSQYLKERGLENVAKEASVPERWQELIGENAARHCTVLRFENKQLTVQVDSSVWRSELRLRLDELRIKLNQALEAEIVQQIILR